MFRNRFLSDVNTELREEIDELKNYIKVLKEENISLKKEVETLEFENQQKEDKLEEVAKELKNGKN